MTSKFPGLLAGGLALAALAAAIPSSALAVTPPPSVKVSVEIEGQSAIVPPTVVQTPSVVNKDGVNECAGNTAIGAIDAASGGNWSGSYSYGSYTVETLLGEAHPFGSGGYWSFYVNGSFANDGACQTQVHDGDKLVFFASDDPFTAGQGGFDEPVQLDAPAAAVPGQAFTVKVTESTSDFNQYPSPTTIAPSAGATVSGGGAAATTGADGTASVTVAGGPYTLVATKGNRAPARIVGCATNGSDGLCGTTKAGGQTAPAVTCITNGNDGFCGTKDTFPAYAAISGVTEGKKYAKGKGPRELKGKVENDASGIKDVRLRLTRNDRGKCASYDGKTEKFKTIKKCGATHGVWFSIGDKADWTYLLPAKLGRGRYVLDVEITDKAGNTTAKLARGTSRVVFTVA